MQSLILCQAVLACFSLFGRLWYFSVPSFVAQVILWFYSFFPMTYLRVAGAGVLAVSFICCSFVLIVSFTRASRFVFYPIKEDFNFFIECFLQIPLQALQVCVCVLEGRFLLKGVARQQTNITKQAVYIMFFHDFAYTAALSYKGWVLVPFSFTQFFTHTILYKMNKSNERLFRRLFYALMIQHLLIGIIYWDDMYVRALSFINLVATAMYLMESLETSRQ